MGIAFLVSMGDFKCIQGLKRSYFLFSVFALHHLGTSLHNACCTLKLDLNNAHCTILSLIHHTSPQYAPCRRLVIVQPSLHGIYSLIQRLSRSQNSNQKNICLRIPESTTSSQTSTTIPSLVLFMRSSKTSNYPSMN